MGHQPDLWVVERHEAGLQPHVIAIFHSEGAAREYIKRHLRQDVRLALRAGGRGPGTRTPDVVWPAQEALFSDTPIEPPAAVGVPALNKLEAVSRLGRLNNAGPESLGPGSKERKSVLANLGRALDLRVDEAASKPELGRQLAQLLGTTWDESCWSTGSTLTLTGLNRLLLAAEQEFARRGVSRDQRFSNSEDEAAAILDVLAAWTPRHFRGEDCVREMGTPATASGHRTSGPRSISSSRASPH